MEKEYYFFDDFTVGAQYQEKCGPITYSLETTGGVAINAAVAEIDQVSVVPGRRRINFKSASSNGDTVLVVVGTTKTTARIVSPAVTITVSDMDEGSYY